MKTSAALTEGQQLLKQAKKELDEFFTFQDNAILKHPEQVIAYSQTLATLELIKALKKKG